MKKLYTVEDLAVFFSRHARTIRNWIDEGLFPHAFRVKDGWFIPERDIKAIMKQKCDLPLGNRPALDKPSKGFVTRWKS